MRLDCSKLADTSRFYFNDENPKRRPKPITDVYVGLTIGYRFVSE